MTLENFINNPLDPKNSYDLAIWYEIQGQYAAAFSFYLRTAEHSYDNELIQIALEKAAHCLEVVGKHDEIVEDLLQHANSLDGEKIDIVLQGGYQDVTDDIARYYLELPFVNNIIISCWDIDKEEVQHPKIKYVRSPMPEVWGTGNRNLQIITSKAGLSKVRTKFCIKARSDQKYTHESLTGMYDFFFKNNERVITFQDDHTKPFNRILVGGNFAEFPFHPKDHILWGHKEDLIDLFSLPLEQHSLYTRAGIPSKDYWKYYDHIIRTESYIGAFYCANFDERIRLFLLYPEKYLFDNAKDHHQAMAVSDWLTPKVFKSFPKHLNQMEWIKYNWKEYPFDRQYNEFGERWHEDGV